MTVLAISVDSLVNFLDVILQPGNGVAILGGFLLCHVGDAALATVPRAGEGLVGHCHTAMDVCVHRDLDAISGRFPTTWTPLCSKGITSRRVCYFHLRLYTFPEGLILVTGFMFHVFRILGKLPFAPAIDAFIEPPVVVNHTTMFDLNVGTLGPPCPLGLTASKQVLNNHSIPPFPRFVKPYR